MSRTIIVSNRLPVNVSKRDGSLHFSQSMGGLATGLASFYKSHGSLWLGWSGYITSKIDEKKYITERLNKDHMHPVFLTRHQIESYYEGFSNNTIWPLFHYFTEHTVYDKSTWEYYKLVNKLFFEEVKHIIKPGDTIWVHDYQLMLLPGMIRQEFPDVRIGFFLHIPFPSFELFRTLPWRNYILEGILGADLIGFHTYDYVRHFLSATSRLLGLEHTLGKIHMDGRIVKIDSFPMGIDYDKFANACNDQYVQKEIDRITKNLQNQTVILSIDRLDYTKAIPQRLRAFEIFLENNPQYYEKIKLILVAVPSRSKVEHYQNLKIEVDELVGRINGNYGRLGWTPIWYLFRGLRFPILTALYNVADIALVTPFRDGMNLIAKEYIASKTCHPGVLILSEMAGAADELGEAIRINPNDIESIRQALEQALEIPHDEQIQRNQEMQSKLKRYDIHRWANDFVGSLNEIRDQQLKATAKLINTQVRRKIVDHYKKSSSRLIFLDYDGTLVSFQKSPDRATPDSQLIQLLQSLASDQSNEVVIISGRDKETLDAWFGELPLNLVAEHGAWLRETGQKWTTIESLKQDWKKDIFPIMQLFEDRTPGSLLERKTFSLAWHYRKADPGLGEMRARELVDTLSYMTSNMDLQILEGSKVIEVKNIGINKGRAALKWIVRQEWEFIFAVGDDWTDEDMFQVIPDHQYAVKVGLSATKANYNIRKTHDVRTLLNALIGDSTS
ncbi:bifunctional alpha,alpha-trehalose-phosphate synthase (UDP-forming)/trehalose-phosphatase [candidate division KSB1 bacterium]|nr:bifunctional alpha,alpha-trehalose-phosphate synthase (UDP-forming)/trehalose-phosphatase [candidate division KSB1 bacterium]